MHESATSSVSRRRFLAGVGAAGASAALGGAAAGARTGPTPTPSTIVSTPPPTATATPTTLVVVTLYGGNDALNTVVPVGDPQYAPLRGALALDPATLHDIGDGFALHPALARCKTLWDAGQLAAIHGVGFGQLDRSHFHCMDVWQSGSEHDMSTGWVGRWLDAEGNSPLDALAVGTNLPLLLRGTRRAAAVVPAGPFDLPGDAEFEAAVARLAAPAAPLGGVAAASVADLIEVAGTVGPLLRDNAGATTGDDGNGEETLAAKLSAVASLIEGELPTRIYSVELRGFDTHAGQAPVHAALLGQLDRALGSFVNRMAMRPVTVVIYSEFGRRVIPNASGGTDHGTGGTVLLAGHVRPGHHGDPPPLDALDPGDLATTTDFRAVFGGLTGDILDIDPADLFDHPPAPLTLV